MIDLYFYLKCTSEGTILDPYQHLTAILPHSYCFCSSAHKRPCRQFLDLLLYVFDVLMAEGSLSSLILERSVMISSYVSLQNPFILVHIPLVLQLCFQFSEFLLV